MYRLFWQVQMIPWRKAYASPYDVFIKSPSIEGDLTYWMAASTASAIRTQSSLQNQAIATHAIDLIALMTIVQVMDMKEEGDAPTGSYFYFGNLTPVF